MGTIGDLIRSRRTTGDQRLPTPRVVIHFYEPGWWTILSDGGEVEVICIDEAVPRDRVYQCSGHKADPGEIDALIGDSRVGKRGDMPGVEAEIRALLNGEPKPKPALTLIKSEDE